MEASLVLDTYNFQSRRSNPIYVFFDTSIFGQVFIDLRPISELISESSSIFRIVDKISQISHVYNFYNASSVKQFLLNNQFLINTLELIYVKTKELFMFSNLYLGVLTDPEEGYEELLVDIDTNLDIDKAILNLDQIIDWFVCSVPDNHRKYITISLK